ncbi:MAG: hypothetical protein H6Q07_281 [Acidobacteria bacterium]|nr:hypothetical protein [Acidobacteriota bacterium]
MSDTSKEIYRLSGQGFCCSQIMIQMGLDARQDENPDLVNAVAGLCGGLYSGLICGTLTGAACLLSLYDRNAAKSIVPRLVEWFKTTYDASCGGINCDEIIGDNPANRFERCPRIMEETYEKCRELLAELGHEI